MTKRTRDYKEKLTEELRDPTEAAAYINAHVEALDGTDVSSQALLMALGDVLRSQGLAKAARATGLQRPNIHRAVSGTTDPRLSTFMKLLKSAHLKVTVEAAPAERRTRRRA